jgi:hypothetical protein
MLYLYNWQQPHLHALKNEYIAITHLADASCAAMTGLLLYRKPDDDMTGCLL